MSLGALIRKHKMNGGGGEYPKSGTFTAATITNVAKITGKDNIESVVVTFQVGTYTPGKDRDGNRYPADTHAPGDLVKFHAKLRPDIIATVLNNLKTAAFGFIKQLQADAGEDPNKVVEDDITEEIIDDSIFCANSQIVGLVVDFVVTEEYTRNADKQGNRGTVTKFTWLTRDNGGAASPTPGDTEEGDEVEEQSTPAPSIPKPATAKGKKS